MSLFDTILAPHDVRWDDEDFMGASLDHCMWFHRPFRADEWLLYDTDSPVAVGGRGLARGFLFDRAGRLCVSLSQEGLVRRRRQSQPQSDLQSRSASKAQAQPQPADEREAIGT